MLGFYSQEKPIENRPGILQLSEKSIVLKDDQNDMFQIARLADDQFRINPFKLNRILPVKICSLVWGAV